MSLRESQNAQDARVEKLWKELDIKKKGELDIQDLQKGLRQLDHRKHYTTHNVGQADRVDSSAECRHSTSRCYESRRHEWRREDTI